MTRHVSLRVPAGLLKAVDRESKAAGLTRTAYVLAVMREVILQKRAVCTEKGGARRG